jgi:hypothetical protein
MAERIPEAAVAGSVAVKGARLHIVLLASIHRPTGAADRASVQCKLPERFNLYVRLRTDETVRRNRIEIASSLLPARTNSRSSVSSAACHKRNGGAFRFLGRGERDFAAFHDNWRISALRRIDRVVRFRHLEMRKTLAPPATIFLSHSSSDADHGWFDRESKRCS